MLFWLLLLLSPILAAQQRLNYDYYARNRSAADIFPDEIKRNLWRIEVVKGIFSYVWLPTPNSPQFLTIFPMEVMKRLLHYKIPNPINQNHCFRSLFWPAIFIQYVIPMLRKERHCPHSDSLNELVNLMDFPPYIENLMVALREVRNIMHDTRRLPFRMSSLPSSQSPINVQAHKIFNDLDRYMTIATSFGFRRSKFLENLKRLPNCREALKMDVVDSPNDHWSFLISAGVDIRTQLEKVNLPKNELVPLNVNFHQMNMISSSVTESIPALQGLKRKEIDFQREERQHKFAHTSKSTRIKDAPSQFNGSVRSGDSWLEHATMAEVADKLLPESVKNELWRFQTAPGKYTNIWLPSPESPLLFGIFPMNRLKTLMGYVSKDASDPELGFKEFFWPAILIQFFVPAIRSSWERKYHKDLLELLYLIPYPGYVKAYMDTFQECRSIEGSRRNLPVDLDKHYNQRGNIKIDPSKIVANLRRYMAVAKSFGLDDKVLVDNFNTKYGSACMIELGSYEFAGDNYWSYLMAMGIDMRTLEKIKVEGKQFVVQNLPGEEMQGILKRQKLAPVEVEYKSCKQATVLSSESTNDADLQPLKEYLEKVLPLFSEIVVEDSNGFPYDEATNTNETPLHMSARRALLLSEETDEATYMTSEYPDSTPTGELSFKDFNWAATAFAQGFYF